MSAPYQLLPALSSDEHAELRADIEAHGVQVPVLVDEDGNIIDGHHRDEIARLLGVPCPRSVVTGYNDVEKRDMALRLNLHRRSLTREQKRELIGASLKADPQLSDRQHAERTASSPTTVGTERRELVNSGRLSNLDSRQSADGRERPATQPSRFTKVRSEALVDTETGEVVDTDAPILPGGRVSQADADLLNGFGRMTPDQIAADARREYNDSPWGVFGRKKRPELRSLVEWLALPEIGGPTGVIASMREMAIPGGEAEDARLVLHDLDEAADAIEALRRAFYEVTTGHLRSVQ